MDNTLLVLLIIIYPRIIGRCYHVQFDTYLNMSLIEFGGSLTHFTIHIATSLLDIAYRREFQLYGVQGYSKIYKDTKIIVQWEIYNRFELRVGEVRAGGAGTSE